MNLSTNIVINGITCIKELEVSFKTRNRTDNQTYYGTIMGTVNFDVAFNFGDVISIHKNMIASVAKTEVTTQDFLLVKTKDSATRPLAVSWIDAETFEKVDDKADAVIIIHRITEPKLIEILTTIRSLGYEVERKN